MKPYLSVFFFILFSCVALTANAAHKPKNNSAVKDKGANSTVNTAEVCADDILYFAETLIGTRYRTAAANPLYGFDCSGFVSYVFKNFNFAVPRSSCEFISVGEKIKLEDALPGDIILFTGTSKKSRRIGHIGILVSNQNSEVTFIHSTSGKEHGVTITAMDDRYKRRFVQIIRLLKQNDEPQTATL
ncbi:cell wall-associated NlpC family hydrolase [Mucilaginibacter gracilis]|uniref:Cell wall-associated NlpC family hydrolase n=1 Tax=Mucilaginibacter gracilis TaxID=423350 RepID=A0A495IUF3_9SPHI|nr:C40 family peptidase [Mucilaginibacter gracilis]RKR80202.1 cell wall-associated NlpC family hydrolase [Mucilaginibacter gracilis]